MSKSRSRSRTKKTAPAPAKKGGTGSGNPAFLDHICLYKLNRIHVYILQEHDVFLIAFLGDPAGAGTALNRQLRLSAPTHHKIGSGSGAAYKLAAPQHWIIFGILQLPKIFDSEVEHFENCKRKLREKLLKSVGVRCKFNPRTVAQHEFCFTSMQHCGARAGGAEIIFLINIFCSQFRGC